MREKIIKKCNRSNVFLSCKDARVRAIRLWRDKVKKDYMSFPNILGTKLIIRQNFAKIMPKLAQRRFKDLFLEKKSAK